jgi:hypothetical protein
MKNDTLLIAECAEYLPHRECGRSAGPTREDVEKALTYLLYQFHKWTDGKSSYYANARHDFLSMFPEGDPC